jgi:glycosyltransferase involved in cell wall biosynthesis
MRDGVTIAIDARAAVEVPAGRGRYVRELLLALARQPEANRYLLYARSPWDARLDERFEWRLIPSRDPLWHLRAARAASREAQVMLSTNSYLTAWFTTIPTAVVVHDMIAFVPEARPQRRASLIERATARPAIRRAAALLCVSEWTRRDLVRLFPRAAPKAQVILEAAAPATAGADISGLGLERPYVLSVGTLEPRKNLDGLVAAWSLLPEDVRKGHTLALVGPQGWELEQVLAPIRGSADDVRLVGYVSDEQLAALYAGCEVFAYPSLYEGFGLPVLEAMQHGAAIVCSNTSSLPEVGGDAVAYVDPHDPADIASKIELLLRTPEERARLGDAARTRAAAFSWDETARQTLAALVALA